MPDSLQVALHNASNSSAIHAYITGIAIQHNGQRIFVKGDGSLYFPTEPPGIGSPLTEDVAIQLGDPGNTVNITIPQIAGGRIWFSVDKPLVFLLNPGGPGLVEPSVLNPSDPNAQTNFSFCEFTLNNDQIFANISYVDFVSDLPIGINLASANGPDQHVTGMSPNGLDLVCEGLRAQANADQQPWDQLIVTGPDGKNLRALSPNHGSVVHPDLFKSYYDPHVQRVYQHYSQTDRQLSINTQAGFGVRNAHVVNNEFSFGDNQRFAAPSTADIFSCSTGPFATGSDPERNAIIPRLAAAYNRSTLFASDLHPGHPSTFYKTPISNHYSRIVHAANADGKGYAFPYDDVQPDDGEDQSGKVNDGNPKLFTVSVGGVGVDLTRLRDQSYAGN